MSNSEGQIYGLLRQAVSRIGAIPKAEQGQGFNFRGRDTVVNAMNPIMAELGITPVRVKTEMLHREYLKTAKGGDKYGVIVSCVWHLYAPDGSFVVATACGEGFDMSDKATGKAHSYAFRQMLVDTFMIRTDDPEPDAERPGVDDDPDTAKARLKRAWGTLVRDVARQRGDNRKTRAPGWIKLVLRHEYDVDGLNDVEHLDPIDVVAELRRACLAVPARYDHDTAEPIPENDPAAQEEVADIERGTA